MSEELERDLARDVGRAFAEIGGRPADPEVARLGRSIAELLGLAGLPRRRRRARFAEWLRERLKRLIRR
jgi:hypothetical protein